MDLGSQTLARFQCIILEDFPQLRAAKSCNSQSLDLGHLHEGRTKYKRMIRGPVVVPAITPIPETPAAHSAVGRGQPGGLAYITDSEYNKKTFNPCAHCGCTNHQSPDCQSLPENKDMWCEHC